MRTGMAFLLTALAIGAHAFAEQEKSASGEEWRRAKPEAIKAWQDMRFGMFIHWGPSSLTGKEISWSRREEPKDEIYDKLYKEFNPIKFDADEWVSIAKAAGMKYLVLTTKHADGFCLWDTKFSDYNIMHTPFKRDVVEELAKACQKEGIAFGAYYSACDWWHPDFPLYGPKDTDKRKPNANMDRYSEYLRNQTKELVENYGPLLTIWFDFPQLIGPEHGEPTVKMLRELQPDILINSRAYFDPVRIAGGAADQNHVGDYNTPEQKIGAYNVERPWETCMTIGSQWSWKPNDKVKSLRECLHTLIKTAGGDGNLLFNVGPMSDGRIEPKQVERLHEIGQWLAGRGDSLYGTRGGPFKPADWGVSTHRDTFVYLHVLHWPKSKLSLPPLPEKVLSAKLINGESVSFFQTSKAIEVDVPKSMRDPIDTIVVLELDKALNVNSGISDKNE